MNNPFDVIDARLSNIENLLLDIKHQPKETADIQESETLLTVQQAAKFLSLSVPTIYGLISKGAIPVMKRSKRCYFSKTELIEYLKEGRQKTNTEIEKEADKYFEKRKQTKMLTPKNK